MLQQHVSHVHSRHHEQRRGHHMSTIGVYIYKEKHSVISRQCVVVLYFVNLLRNYKSEIEICNVYLTDISSLHPPIS